MFEEPRDDCVSDRDVLLQTRLKAELERPEQPADHPHADLRRAVRLRVVLSGLLLRQLLEVLELDLRDVGDALDESL